MQTNYYNVPTSGKLRVVDQMARSAGLHPDGSQRALWALQILKRFAIYLEAQCTLAREKAATQTAAPSDHSNILANLEGGQSWQDALDRG